MSRLSPTIFGGNWQFLPAIRLKNKFLQKGILEYLTRAQSLGENSLKEIQQINLSLFLKKISEESNTWNLFFKKNDLDINSSSLDKDVRTLPVLNKVFYKKNLDFTVGVKSLKSNTYFTSGSSGIPFVMRLDAVSCFWRYLIALRGNNWAGYDENTKFLRITRTRYPDPMRQFAEPESIFLTWGIGELSVNFLREITHAPMILYSFIEFFRQLKQKTQNERISNIKSIIMTGEALSEMERGEFENFFKAPVYMSYSSREFGRIAQECEYKNGFHINAERFLIEIVDSNGNRLDWGWEGKIVITDTKNFVMPFLRFDIGDNGYILKETCLCGKTLPRLFLTDRNTYGVIFGQKNIRPYALFAAVNQFSRHILRYQIIQRDKNDFTILIDPLNGFCRKEAEKIKFNLANILGRDINADVDWTTKNFIIKNGKQIPFVSLLK